MDNFVHYLRIVTFAKVLQTMYSIESEFGIQTSTLINQNL